MSSGFFALLRYNICGGGKINERPFVVAVYT